MANAKEKRKGGLTSRNWGDTASALMLLLSLIPHKEYHNAKADTIVIFISCAFRSVVILLIVTRKNVA